MRQRVTREKPGTRLRGPDLTSVAVRISSLHTPGAPSIGRAELYIGNGDCLRPFWRKFLAGDGDLQPFYPTTTRVMSPRQRANKKVPQGDSEGVGWSFA